MKRRFVTHGTPSGEFVGNANQTVWRVEIAEGKRVITDRFSAGFYVPERADALRAEWNARPDMLAKMRNLRFWQYANGGFVKITLRPGQTLSHSKSYDNGEGWSHVSETWEHDGDGVLLDWAESGSDCDGRSSSGGKAFCPAAQLASRNPYVPPGAEPPPFLLPEFEPMKRWQRDHTAEAAGY